MSLELTGERPQFDSVLVVQNELGGQQFCTDYQSAQINTHKLTPSTVFSHLTRGSDRELGVQPPIIKSLTRLNAYLRQSAL